MRWTNFIQCTAKHIATEIGGAHGDPRYDTLSHTETEEISTEIQMAAFMSLSVMVLLATTPMKAIVTVFGAMAVLMILEMLKPMTTKLTVTQSSHRREHWKSMTNRPR